MNSPTKTPANIISKGFQGSKSTKIKVVGTPTPRKSSKRSILVTPKSRHESKSKTLGVVRCKGQVNVFIFLTPFSLEKLHFIFVGAHAAKSFQS